MVVVDEVGEVVSFAAVTGMVVVLLTVVVDEVMGEKDFIGSEIDGLSLECDENGNSAPRMTSREGILLMEVTVVEVVVVLVVFFMTSVVVVVVVVVLVVVVGNTKPF